MASGNNEEYLGFLEPFCPTFLYLSFLGCAQIWAEGLLAELEVARATVTGICRLDVKPNSSRDICTSLWVWEQPLLSHFSLTLSTL